MRPEEGCHLGFGLSWAVEQLALGVARPVLAVRAPTLLPDPEGLDQVLAVLGGASLQVCLLEIR